MDFEELINQDVIQKSYFCICCLEKTGMYVKLANCGHREYLDSITLPEFLSDVACQLRSKMIVRQLSAYLKCEVSICCIIASNCDVVSFVGTLILLSVPRYSSRKSVHLCFACLQDPSVPDTVCYKCHDMLKKITSFKLQVKHSFDIIEKKVNTLGRSVQSNLKISKTLHLNIPELIENEQESPEIKPEKSTKMKNIQTAFDILNTNTKSLQSLISSHNFIGLTEALLEATNNSFNLSSMSMTVLPGEIKREPDTEFIDEPIVNGLVNTDIELNNIQTVNKECCKQEIKKEVEIDMIDEKSESITNNNEVNVPDSADISNQTVVLPDYINISSEIQEASKKNNAVCIKNEIKNKENNDTDTTLLPTENKLQCNDVVFVSSYGTAVLPDMMKCDPEDVNDVSTRIENCLGENSQKKSNRKTSTTSANKIVKDGARRHKSRRLASLSLIPIKLSDFCLLDERREKLRSHEFLRWEHRCDKCIIGFLFKENLDDHNRRKHLMTVPKAHVKCEICRQVMFNGELKGHMFRHYNRLECGKCKKRFVLFDEAYDHYSSVHTPLQKKHVVKRQLKIYGKSKRLKANEGKSSDCRAKSPVSETVISTPEKDGTSNDLTELMLEK